MRDNFSIIVALLFLPGTMGIGVYGLFADDVFCGVSGFAGFSALLGYYLLLIEENTRS